MSLRLGTRLVSAGLLLPLLALSVATGGMWLRCRVTGAVAQACCCPADAEDGPSPPSRAAAHADEDCCDRLVVASTDLPTEPASVSQDHARAPAWTAAPVASRLDAGLQPARAARARAGGGRQPPPATTRARLVAKSAFLI